MQATKLFKQILWVQVFILCSTICMWAGKMEYSKKKEFTNSFPTNANTTLYVNNRFGNISIEHWNKNEVKIHVVIEAKAGNSKRIEENLNKVSVDISQFGNTIKALTCMNNLNQQNNEQITVDYTILAPSNIKLNLEQEFGNIALPDQHHGESSLKIKFGNIAGKDFLASLSVESKFSNVIIGNLTNVDIHAEHSGKIMIADADNVNAKCQFSNLTIGEAKNIKLNETHSQTHIKACNNVTLQAQHSGLSIDELKESAIVESLAHSSLDINELYPDFILLKIQANFGTIKIKTPSYASFFLDANASFGEIKLDTGFQLSDLNNIEKNNKKNLKCKVNGGQKGRIEFNGSFSNMAIKEYNR